MIKVYHKLSLTVSTFFYLGTIIANLGQYYFESVRADRTAEHPSLGPNIRQVWKDYGNDASDRMQSLDVFVPFSSVGFVEENSPPSMQIPPGIVVDAESPEDFKELSDYIKENPGTQIQVDLDGACEE